MTKSCRLNRPLVDEDSSQSKPLAPSNITDVRIVYYAISTIVLNVCICTIAQAKEN